MALAKLPMVDDLVADHKSFHHGLDPSTYGLPDEISEWSFITT
jgi:hypothetical protein